MKIYDNIDQSLLPTLREKIRESSKSDFCVGYFNLRGWKSISDLIQNFSGGDDAQCRLLVGMKFMEEKNLGVLLRYLIMIILIHFVLLMNGKVILNLMMNKILTKHQFDIICVNVIYLKLRNK